MSVLITDHRTVWNEADAITGWAGGAATLFTADPDPVEATGCIGVVVSTATVDSYFATTATSLANKIVYAWALPRGAMDTRAAGGVGMHIGDGTNRISYHLAGSDVAGFRHDVGPVSWQNIVWDDRRKPATTTVRAGTLAALNTGSVTQIGITYKTLAKSVGGVSNCFTDIIRIGDPTLNNGAMITITSGSSTDPGTFEQIAAADRLTGTGQGTGIVRQLGAGSFGVQGRLRFGNAAGTDSSWFADKNVTVIFEDRGLATDRYGIVIVDNGTGTTTFRLGEKVGTGTTATGTSGVSIVVPTGVGCLFDSQTDTDVTDVFIYGSTFTGFSNGIFLRSGQEFIGNIVNSSGTIFPSGSTMVNCTINNSIASSSLYWNGNVNPNGLLDGCSFLASGSNNHAIEFGPTVPVTMSLVDVTYNNYGLDNTSGSALYNNSGKALQIIVTGGDLPTVRNGTGATTTLVTGLTNVTLTGLVDGTEVRVIDNVSQNELTGIESTSGGEYTFQLSSGVVVDIVIHNLQYEYIRINGFEIPATDTSIPIEQRFDRNYSNPT